MMKQKLFLDVEFNGFRGDLISLALVSDDSQEWYEVLSEPIAWNDWVYENVFPKLGKEPIGETAFKSSLHQFLRQFDCPTVICDAHADLVHFFASFQGAEYTSSLIDFHCKVELLADSECKPDNPHNALSDARALRDWYLSQYIPKI